MFLITLTILLQPNLHFIPIFVWVMPDQFKIGFHKFQPAAYTFLYFDLNSQHEKGSWMSSCTYLPQKNIMSFERKNQRYLKQISQYKSWAFIWYSSLWFHSLCYAASDQQIEHPARYVTRHETYSSTLPTKELHNNSDDIQNHEGQSQELTCVY